ncbi:anthranilate phosphoribosyltransferase [Enterococcus sp. 669A]|uniref:Anthranilate phosphoribosyltransferase n=1 Tax=Candidatus Enterococcus moelleringii TaxID=2815325 RepID=A0ABS3L684_9ENTE|nr:anthranilate phosphoribosyltransferase [Enterococcus sp. 669A]MBO1304605.1 anthranilate phosphoribosyltransferase [Enterococcus sp. 669A]
MQPLFEKVYQGQNLTTNEMIQISSNIFEGKLSDTQISALLIALKLKGVTSEELTGLATIMQGKAEKMLTPPKGVMDNCGTGGDHSNSFNISTTAAFVLAGGGIPMAKHGNRSVSSRSGSADVLESLGISLTVSPEKIDYLLREVGIAFLFSPAMHPAMKYVMGIRRDLATPTIFNLIGPIINPYRLDNQLMGTFAGDSISETAETLGKMGRKKAIVVHGAHGMDEANLAGTTNCAVYQDGKVSNFSFTPEEYGFERAPLSAIVGGEAQQNRDILLSVLQNEASVYYDTVLLNAGLGFLASGKAASLEAGIMEAKQSLKSGAAMDCLQKLIREQRAVA